MTGQDQELRQSLLRYLKAVLVILQNESQTNPSTPRIAAHFDPTALPWKSFSSGKGEWIKSDLAEAGALREAVSKSQEGAVIDGFLYKLSGSSGQFINRLPHAGRSSQ